MKFALRNEKSCSQDVKLRLRSQRGSFTVEASVIFAMVLLLIMFTFSYMGFAYHSARLNMLVHENLYVNNDKRVEYASSWKHLGSSDVTNVRVVKERHSNNISLKLFEFRTIRDLAKGVLEDE